jgi:GAF domain-containing protein/anti-anti-sigma regulatory factor
VLDGLGESVLVYDAGGRLTYLNRAARALLGCKEEGGLPGDVAPAAAVLAAGAVTAALRDGTWNGEVTVPLPGGRSLAAMVSARAEKGADGRALLVSLVVRDHATAVGYWDDRELNEHRTEVLLKLNQMSGATMQELTDFALEEAVRLTRSTIGYLAFMSEDEKVLTMHSWSKSAMNECSMIDKPIVYPIEKTGLWGEAVRQRKPVTTNDYPAPNPLKKGHPEGHVKVTRHMNIPVFDGDRIVAVAGVGNKATDYTESDIRQLTLLMDGMWKILARHRMEDELRLNEYRTAALLKLNQMIGATLQDITHYALEEGIVLTRSKIGYLAFMSEDEKVLTMYAWSKTAMDACSVIDKPIVYPIEKTGLWGEAVRQRKPVITNDYAAPNPLKKGHPEGHVRVDRHMNIPVYDGERIVAVMGVGNKEKDYNEDDVRQLTLLADGMWKILARKKMEDALQVKNRELEDKLAMIEAQRMAISQLSTPIIQVWDEVLCLPVVGAVDTARSSEMTDRLLEAVVKHRARAVIVDITGIDMMDTKTADHFIKMAKAVRMLGADPIVTGMSPSIAQTLTHIGVELGELQTLRSMSDALRSLVSASEEDVRPSRVRRVSRRSRN